MKLQNQTTLLSSLALAAFAQAQSVPGFQNIVRMIEPGSNGSGSVIWDMPGDVPANGQDVLVGQPVPENGAIFVLRTIEENPFRDWFLDSTAVGSYLPLADIRVLTHDPESLVPRTRADRPIRISATVSGLFQEEGSSNGNVQQAAQEVRLQLFSQAYAEGENSLPGGELTAEAHTELALRGNGEFPRAAGQLDFFSSVNLERPEKARGEEHFVIRSLSDGNFTSETLDQVAVEVWPVWDCFQEGLESPDLLRYNFDGIEAEKTALEMGSIEPDENFRARVGERSYSGTPPTITFTWRDLFPSSTVGIIVNDATIPYPWGGRWVGGTKRVFNENDSFDYETTVSDWGDIFTGPGRYAIWMVTHTPGIGWEIGGEYDSEGNVTEGGWICPIQRPSIEMNGSIHSLSE